MNIRPLNEKILVERIKTPEKVGSLFVPDAHREKGERAKVLAVGKGKILDDGRRRPMELAVGQVVILSKWPGGEVKLAPNSDKEHLIISEDEVLGIEE